MLKTIAKWSFYGLAGVTLLWTSYRTVHILYSTTNTLVIALLGLAVADIGIVVWLLQYISGAQGIPQRIISGVLTVVDTVTVATIATCDIWLSQTLVAAPEVFRSVAIWTVIIATIANLTAIILMHLTDSEVRRQMALRSAQDEVFERAYQQLQQRVSSMADSVAESVSNSMTEEAIRIIAQAAKLPADRLVSTSINSVSSSKPIPTSGGVPISTITTPIVVPDNGDIEFEDISPKDVIARESGNGHRPQSAV